MLPLPRVELHHPVTLGEACELLARHPGDARILAGGTDLLPNLKHELHGEKHLIALSRIPSLGAIQVGERSTTLGAMARLQAVADHPEVRRRLPSLAQAAGAVAGPQLRAMGTVGGNACLDTRCLYYNQTYFWREALGFCLKKDGTVCHVVAGGKRCVAAASNDTAPPLITLGAVAQLVSARGSRSVPFAEFYSADGLKNTVLEAGELLSAIEIPRGPAGRISGFAKLRVRNAIDFPLLNVAVRVDLAPDRTVAALAVAVSALGAKPLQLRKLEPLVGQPLGPALVEQVGAAAFAQAHPLENLAGDTAWRREVLPALVREAFAAAS